MQQIDLQVIGSIVDQMAKVINSRKFEWITYNYFTHVKATEH